MRRRPEALPRVTESNCSKENEILTNDASQLKCRKSANAKRVPLPIAELSGSVFFFLFNESLYNLSRRKS